MNPKFISTSMCIYLFFTDDEESEEDCMNFVVVDEFQGKFVPAVSKFSHHKRWCTIKVDVFLLISLRWRTSRGSMRSVLEPMALSCSKMGDCVGCRWPPKFSLFDFPSIFLQWLTRQLKFFLFSSSRLPPNTKFTYLTSCYLEPALLRMVYPRFWGINTSWR